MSRSKGTGNSFFGIILVIIILILVLYFARPLLPLLFRLLSSLGLIVFALFAAGIVFILMVVRHYAALERRMKNKQLSDGITQKDLNEVMDDAKRKLRQIDSSIYEIQDMEMKKDIQTIIKTGNKILEVLKKEPKKIKTAKKFLNYYLDSTVNILENYQALNISESVIEKNEQVIEKVSGTLKDIIKCFEYEYAKLFDDTAMNLDVEIEVLKASIEQKIRQ